jgi:hypothetical protein
VNLKLLIVEDHHSVKMHRCISWAFTKFGLCSVKVFFSYGYVFGLFDQIGFLLSIGSSNIAFWEVQNWKYFDKKEKQLRLTLRDQ